MSRGARSASVSRLLTIMSLALLVVCSTSFVDPAPVTAAQSDAPHCAPGVEYLGFSDALDKQNFEGSSVGGLSALTYDQRRDV